MPLTAKGEKIEAAMEKQYGAKKGESVFYASRNAGTITGVDSGCPQTSYMDACRRGDSTGMQAASDAILRGRLVR